MMVDTEICVDRIAAMRVHDMNVVLAEVRKMVIEKHNPGENDLYIRTLELAQIDEEEYFNRIVHDDLDKIIADIREAHKKDSTTADTVYPSDTVRQELEAAISYEGSPQERQARVFCKQLGIDYDKLSKEEFISLINILKKSTLLKVQPNKRGKNNSKKK